MRPQADEVEFLYEIMSVTGEAMPCSGNDDDMPELLEVD
jgi:hypothetical protein